jgi:hypothetical protein
MLYSMRNKLAVLLGFAIQHSADSIIRFLFQYLNKL